MENLFITGTRKNVTFTELGGILTIADIWDLPLLTKASHGKCLDKLYLELEEQVAASNAGQGKSIIRKTVKTDEILDVKFGIVKYIIEVKMAEAEAAAAAKEKSEKLSALLEQLSDIENTERKGMSKAEVLAEIEKLKG